MFRRKAKTDPLAERPSPPPYTPGSEYIGRAVPHRPKVEAYPEQHIANILGDYAITTRTAQPRRVLPGEIISRLRMERPASNEEQVSS